MIVEFILDEEEDIEEELLNSMDEIYEMLQACKMFFFHICWCLVYIPVGIYRLKVNNRNTRTRC